MVGARTVNATRRDRIRTWRFECQFLLFRAVPELGDVFFLILLNGV